MDAPTQTQARGQNSLSSAKKTQKASNPRGKYAWRACQECRRRRSKCDGAKPSCSRCINMHSTCVYDTGDDHRGTAPKSLVRLLQARVNILEQILQMHSIDIDESAAKLMAKNVCPASGSSSTTASPSVFDQLCTDFEGALCFDESVNFDQDGQPRYFGRTSGRLEFETTDSGPTERIPTMNTGQCFDLYVQSLQAEPAISQELTSQIIDLYFQWEQPWCQIVDEKLFRESHRTNGPYSSLLLLKCILAVGSRYCDAPEVRSDPDDPNTAGKRFLETAEILLHFDLKWPSITTIQSLSLLATYYVAMGSDAAGWLHHGMAIQLSLDRGLNLDPSSLAGSTRIPCEELALRRRIYWVLYCTDKLWASYTGRVCTMLSPQAAVELPSPKIADESNSSPNPINDSNLASLHHSMSTHCQILEEILVNLYAPKRNLGLNQAKSFFESCLVSLQNWYYNLPVELKVERGSDKNNPFPHAHILCMVYHTSTILLTRPFVPKTHATPSSSNSPPQETLREDMMTKAERLCVEAAKEISLIGDKYRQTFGSFRKSPITATHCTLTAALVLLNAECLKGECGSGAEMTYINSCIKTLKELSISWTPPRRYWCSLKRLVNLRRLPGHDCEEIEQELDGKMTSVGGDQNSVFAGLHENMGTFQQMSGNMMLQDDFVFDEPFWQGFMPDLTMDLQQDMLDVNTSEYQQQSQMQ